MKTVLSFFALFFCVACSFSREFTVEVRVVDQDAKPVQGVHVMGSFVFFGSDSKTVKVEGETDAQGMLELEGEGETQVSLFVSKNGYYDSVKSVNLYKSDGRGYSQPHNPQVEFVLKEIRNPVPMIARGGSIRLLLPSLSEPVGFDLFENDWVSPHGKGKTSDIVFEYSGHVELGNVDAELITSIENGGLLKFQMETGGSVFKSGYYAPEDVSIYSSSLVHKKNYQTENGFTTDNSTYLENIGYYLLLRPKYDSAGNLIEAYYGKIYGDFSFNPTISGKCEVQFSAYYVNPSVNDRNVECDIGQNILRLPSREIVRAP